MSAFSRGLLFRPQCAFNIKTFSASFEPLYFRISRLQLKSSRPIQSKAVQQSRNFSSTITFRAAKKARPVKPATPAKQPPPTQSKLAGPPKTQRYVTPEEKYEAFAASLVKDSIPVLLYKAPSHRVYIISSYLTAGFCFAYALIAYTHNVVHIPEGVSLWVPKAFAIVCAGMIAFGGYLLLGTWRLTRKITAIPTQVDKLAKTFGKQALKSPLQMEVMVRSTIPFLGSERLLVDPQEITFSTRLVPTRNLTPAQERALKVERELALQRLQAVSGILSRVSRSLHSGFNQYKKMWTQEGFVWIKVKEKKYRLDLYGWGHENGRTLDRLVKHKARL